MVRLAHTSDSLALPQAVACFVLLLSFAPPAALAQQYHVNGRVWKYGDILRPGTYADDSEKTEEEPQAKNKTNQDDYGTEPPSAPQPKPGSNRHGTIVPRQPTHRQPPVVEDDDGNRFLWLSGPGVDHPRQPPPPSPPQPLPQRPQAQLLRDDNGNYFWWLTPGGADGVSNIPNESMAVDPPEQLMQPRSRGAPARRTAAIQHRRRAGYYYYWYSVPVQPPTY